METTTTTTTLAPSPTNGTAVPDRSDFAEWFCPSVPDESGGIAQYAFVMLYLASVVWLVAIVALFVYERRLVREGDGSNDVKARLGKDGGPFFVKLVLFFAVCLHLHHLLYVQIWPYVAAQDCADCVPYAVTFCPGITVFIALAAVVGVVLLGGAFFYCMPKEFLVIGVSCVYCSLVLLTIIDKFTGHNRKDNVRSHLTTFGGVAGGIVLGIFVSLFLIAWSRWLWDVVRTPLWGLTLSSVIVVPIIASSAYVLAKDDRESDTNAQDMLAELSSWWAWLVGFGCAVGSLIPILLAVNSVTYFVNKSNIPKPVGLAQLPY